MLCFMLSWTAESFLERSLCEVTSIQRFWWRRKGSGPGQVNRATLTRSDSQLCPRSAQRRHSGSWWVYRYQNVRTRSGHAERVPCTWPLKNRKQKKERAVSKSIPHFMLDEHRGNANGMQMCMFTSWKPLIKCEQAERFLSVLVNRMFTIIFLKTSMF